MNFDISDFFKIIENHATGEYDDQSAAHMAHSEAFNLAARWADGRYTIPAESEFLTAIKEKRNAEHAAR